MKVGGRVFIYTFHAALATAHDPYSEEFSRDVRLNSRDTMTILIRQIEILAQQKQIQIFRLRN